MDGAGGDLGLKVRITPIIDQGKLSGREIECPRHGARFDVVTGKALCLSAIRPVRTYATRVSGEAIEVELP